MKIKESSRIGDEESIVSSIQADEIEEVEFPEFDIELMSQENVEEGSNNDISFKSIVVQDIDVKNASPINDENNS